jgi:hypothetical protein
LTRFFLVNDIINFIVFNTFEVINKFLIYKKKYDWVLHPRERIMVGGGIGFLNPLPGCKYEIRKNKSLLDGRND